MNIFGKVHYSNESGETLVVHRTSGDVVKVSGQSHHVQLLHRRLWRYQVRFRTNNLAPDAPIFAEHLLGPLAGYVAGASVGGFRFAPLADNWDWV